MIRGYNDVHKREEEMLRYLMTKPGWHSVQELSIFWMCRVEVLKSTIKIYQQITRWLLQSWAINMRALEKLVKNNRNQKVPKSQLLSGSGFLRTQ